MKDEMARGDLEVEAAEVVTEEKPISKVNPSKTMFTPTSLHVSNLSKTRNSSPIWRNRHMHLFVSTK